MKHLVPFRIYESQTTSGLTKKQEDFLNRNTKGTWSVNPTTGLVDVRGDFDCSGKGLKSLSGISFGHVSGNFYCQRNQLTSLEGAPQTVDGYFTCDEFELDPGEWNMEGWLEVLRTRTGEAKKLILTLPYIQPDWWNSELQRDPGKTVHLLAPWWKDMPENMKSKIKIPSGYENEFNLFSEFDELGLF